MTRQKKKTVKVNTPQLKEQVLKTPPRTQKRIPSRANQLGSISSIQAIPDVRVLPDFKNHHLRAQVNIVPQINRRMMRLRYFGMFFAVAASIAFVLHCLVMPFLSPIFATLLYGTVFAQDLHLFAVGLTFFVSGMMAFLITEKIQSHDGNGFLQQENDHAPVHHDFNPAPQETVVQFPLKESKLMTFQFHHHQEALNSQVQEQNVMQPNRAARCHTINIK